MVGRLSGVPATDFRALRELLDGLPVSAALGLRCVEVDHGLVRVAMEAPAALLDGEPTVPFALVYGLADAAASYALHTVVAPEDLHVTTELTVHQVRAPARGALEAEGRVLRHGRRTAFAEVRVSDPAGALCALGSGTWAVVADSPHSIARHHAETAP